MGEVYRARDTRLGRDVAVKVLPSSFSRDADRLRRFEGEAKAASLLNHPNITAIFDVGQQDGSPYVVSELLEGETLRSRLAAGALSPRKATEYAIQIAQGLAAAHDKGIVHRDLKPENLFVTEDGRIKILDFGLAKLIQPEGAAQQTSAPTASLGTEPGVVMGTAGYMSPEQVKGQPADHRSDIFAFGAILYEMLSGRRAFRGDSAVETMSAILKEDPPDLSETTKNLSPGLERLVRHCLEKAPAQRFQSARDLAYDLESLSSLSGASAAKALPSRSPLRGVWIIGGVAVLAVLLGWFLHGRFHRPTSPTYQQVTYRRGVIYGARFAPDGETIVYGASWNGQPIRVFSTRIGSAESRDLGLPPADILAISRAGELAVCLGRGSIFTPCTLARVPLAGGAPREISSDVYQADWAPDGRDLAVIRRLPDKNVLEYPVGKVLYTTPNNLYSVRFSPRGDLLAFSEEFPSYQCEIDIFDLARGKKRVVTRTTFSRYLAWRTSGDEIWFDSAERGGFATSVHAVTLSGRERAVRADATSLNTQDFAKDGRALVISLTLSSSMAAAMSGESGERNVSWLDYSTVDDVSADGRTILFDEWGEGGGRSSAYYLWRLSEPAAIRLGEGVGHALSPDGKWALMSPPSVDELILQPTGTGQPRSLGKRNMEIIAAVFLPDGTAVVSIAREPGHGWRLYRQGVAAGDPPKAFSGEGITSGRLTVSPDGRFVAARGKDEKMCIFPLSGERPRCFDAAPGDEPLQWSADSRFVFICPVNDIPGKIDRLDVASGHRELWKSFGPSDLAGVQRFQRVAMALGGASFVYSTERVFCTLFVIDGLR